MRKYRGGGVRVVGRHGGRMRGVSPLCMYIYICMEVSNALLDKKADSVCTSG